MFSTKHFLPQAIWLVGRLARWLTYPSVRHGRAARGPSPYPPPEGEGIGRARNGDLWIHSFSPLCWVPPLRSTKSTICVDVYSCVFQFLNEFHLPTSSLIQWDVDNSIIIRWNLYVSFCQGADSISAKAPDKISELENDVLSGTRFQIRRVFLECTYVVRRQESYGESNLSVMFEFLDDGPALIRLLV